MLLDTNSTKEDYYIEKDVLLADITNWQEKKKEALSKGNRPPIMPDSIGKAILLITNRIATRHNFRNYTYLDEMKGDAIVVGTKSMDSFDPKVSQNPFGYLSMVIWRAFVGRINKEKKLHDTKMRLSFDPSGSQPFDTLSHEKNDFNDLGTEDVSGAADFYYGNKVT